MKKIIVAIDGHSSCGKSTMAKALAAKVGYTYVDTGAMYRVVTLYSIRNGFFTEDGIDTEALKSHMDDIHITFRISPEGKQETCLNGQVVEKEIRGMEVSGKVSPIAALDFVRSAMVAQQRQMGIEKGIVMDGRDIGTVVYPDAELKIFVTASDTVRAQRRFDELSAKGENASYEEILENVRQRDYIDSHREVSPLRQAADALVLDNSNMTLQEQDEWLIANFRRATEQD